MTLPKRPPLNNPIPNSDIPNVPREYIVKAPYWDAVLGGDLTVDADGALTLTGGTGDGNSNLEVLGSYWAMPIGVGLNVDASGKLIKDVPPYIYCTPAYPELPPTEPPYSCNTEVNTAGVTDFTDAWKNCSYLTEFPCIDSSSVTDFTRAWFYCESLTDFPTLNLSSGEDFTSSWSYSGLTSFPMLDMRNGLDFSYTWCGCIYMTEFPALNLGKGESFLETWYYCSGLEEFGSVDVSSGEIFESSWYGCSNLTSFPALDVSSGTTFVYAWGDCSSLTSFPLLNVSSGTNFNFAWNNCTSLTTFPAEMFDSCLATSFINTWQNCALSQQSVDNILVSINTAGTSNGILTLSGGTSAAPSATGLAAITSLQARGWTVTTN